MLRQPYELSTAFRYLRARSKNGFISFISLVSMVGIGLAVAVLVVVLSVMNGFERELQQRILGIVSHATIMGYDEPLPDWQSTRERILTYPEVTGAAPYVEGQGMVVFDDNVAGVTVGPLSKFLDERGIKPVRVPGPALRVFNRAQRLLGMTRYHAGFHPKRLFYSLVLDDTRFEKIFRSNSQQVG